uniref:Uncharacterized protein n=1 Tax=Globisporangium ultimum (strain ATCC 200006 / CBS 805.95 / DAOM BR144) TaxID=431595 RepID=K3X759_GLOUD
MSTESLSFVIAAPEPQVASEPTLSPMQTVFTDRTLLHQVCTWLPGWPSVVGDFITAAYPKYEDEDARADYKYDPHVYPKLVDGFPSFSQLAVAENDLNMLTFLYHLQEDPYYALSGMIAFDQDLFRCAVAFGRLELLIYLSELIPDYATWSWQSSLMQVAVNKGRHLEILDWLHHHCASVAALKLHYLEPDTITSHGDLDLVRWFHEHGYVFTTYAMNTTAEHGHLDIVRFLHEKRSEGCTVNAMSNAAANGHLDVIQFLHEHRTEGCTMYAMDQAAANGHLNVVRFLHEHRSEGCTTTAMDAAAGNGHLEIVQFLYENRSEGCTTDAVDGAAMNGHLEVVEYLFPDRSPGCSYEAVQYAENHGHDEIVAYIMDNVKAVEQYEEPTPELELLQMFEQTLGF